MPSPSAESVALARVAEGVWRLQGELTFATVPALVDAIDSMDGDGGVVEVQLEDVGRVDSAGVALLIDWARRAARRGLRLRLRGAPAGLHQIAELSGVEALLPVAAGGEARMVNG